MGGVILIISLNLLLISCSRRRTENGKIAADETGKVPSQENAVGQYPQVVVEPFTADPQESNYEVQKAPASAPTDNSSVSQAHATEISLEGHQAPIDPSPGQ